MRILVLGSGAREHTLAWKLSQEAGVTHLICAPGNAGISRTISIVPIDILDTDAVIRLVDRERIDLTVVGPEAPLGNGLVDRFEADGRRVFGPTRAAAQLETSKAFAKDFMHRHHVPTARYRVCTSAEDAMAAIRSGEFGDALVVKADGLAAGKGVVVAPDRATAEAAVSAAMIDRSFGDAGSRIVLEELLTGPEVSFFVVANGEQYIPLLSAQDHKRIFDDDQGPNTGGMGAYSPAPIMTTDVTGRALDEIIVPTIRAMKTMGCPFKGVLLAGLMITRVGPKLIEYNVRFGDPECQVLMLRLMSDLVPALLAARDGMLKNFDLRWFAEAALTVIMAANGYPGEYRKGSVIEGLEVRSRTSSFAWKGKSRDVHEAGKQLRAEYILEGSVLRDQQQLRINAQLLSQVCWRLAHHHSFLQGAKVRNGIRWTSITIAAPLGTEYCLLRILADLAQCI